MTVGSTPSTRRCLDAGRARREVHVIHEARPRVALSRPRAVVRGTRLTDDDSVQLGEHVWGRDLHLRQSVLAHYPDCSQVKSCFL